MNPTDNSCNYLGSEPYLSALLLPDNHARVEHSKMVRHLFISFV